MMPISQDRYLYFARVGGGSFSYREDGSHKWLRPEFGKLPAAITAAIGLAPPSSYQQPPIDDSGRWRASLAEAVSEIKWQGIAPLGLHDAPDYWRKFVWSEFGQAIREKLARYDVQCPVRVGDTVEFRSPLSLDELIPPDDAGFAEMLQRIRAGRHRYGQTQEHVKAWWGREFPRGVADEREIARIEIDDVSADFRLEMAQQNGFAATQIGDRSWAVAHVPSRRIVTPIFGDLDASKLAARWLASRFTDTHGMSVNPRVEALLRWLSTQSDLPTLAGLNTAFESGRLETFTAVSDQP
jgi:hypothetical protein